MRFLEVISKNDFQMMDLYKDCFVKNYFGYVMNVAFKIKALMRERKPSLVLFSLMIELIEPMLKDEYMFENSVGALMNQFSND